MAWRGWPSVFQDSVKNVAPRWRMKSPNDFCDFLATLCHRPPTYDSQNTLLPPSPPPATAAAVVAFVIAAITVIVTSAVAVAAVVSCRCRRRPRVLRCRF